MYKAMSHKDNCPFFSVVIPTRKRPELIEANLYSLRNQTFDDFEVIVSDNTFEDTCKNVFDKYADARFSYIQPQNELNMADNWDYALSKARGLYVTVLEDKHYFYFDSLQSIYDVLTNRDLPDILNYGMDYFIPYDEKQNIGCLMKRLRTKISNVIDIEAKIEEKLKHEINNVVSVNEYGPFGALTIGMVKNEIIDQIRQKNGSVFKKYFNPDWGLSLEFLCNAKTAVCMKDSQVIISGSKKSNGGKCVRSIKSLEDFIDTTFCGRERLKYATVPNYCATATNLVTADYNYAIETIPRLKGKKINRISSLINIYKESEWVEDWISEERKIEEQKKFNDILNTLNLEEWKLFQNNIIDPIQKNFTDCYVRADVGDIKSFFNHEIQKEKILDFSKKYTTLYCYGAGDYGQAIVDYLRINNIDIEAYIVTDGESKPATIRGIPVYTVSEIVFNTSSFGVILSLHYQHHEQVKKILKDKKISNIYSAVAYEYIKNYIKKTKKDTERGNL